MNNGQHTNFLNLADNSGQMKRSLEILECSETPDTDSLSEKYYSHTLQKNKIRIESAVGMGSEIWTDMPEKQADYIYKLTKLPKKLVALACLISKKFDPKGEYGIHSLPWKLRTTDMWTLIYALKEGVDVNQTLIAAVSRPPNRDLHPLYYRAMIKRILREGAKINEIHLYNLSPFLFCQATALMCAAKSGQIESVEELLICGADPSITTMDGRSAIFYALSLENSVSLTIRLAILRMLLKAGGKLSDAECNPVSYFLAKRTTSPFQEVKGEDIELLDKEFKNKNLNRVNDAEINQIFKDGFKKFIEKEDTCTDLVDNREFLRLALYYDKANMDRLFNYACKDRKEDMAFNFLLAHGADVNRVDKHGNPPLFYVINNNQDTSIKEAMVAKLLEKKADVNYKKGPTALMLAFTGKQYSLNIIKMLLEKGADINSLTEWALQKDQYLMDRALREDQYRKRLIPICESLRSEFPLLKNVLECLRPPEKKPNNAKTNKYLIDINKLRSVLDIWENYRASECGLESKKKEDMLYKHFCELKKHSDNVNKLSEKEVAPISERLAVDPGDVDKPVVNKELESLWDDIDKCKKEIETSIQTLNGKLVENGKIKFANNKKEYNDALSRLEEQIRNPENPKNSVVVMNDDWGDSEVWGKNLEEEKINKLEDSENSKNPKNSVVVMNDNWGDDLGVWGEKPEEETIGTRTREDSDNDDDEDAIESAENNASKAELLIQKDILLQVGKYYKWTTSEYNPDDALRLYQNSNAQTWFSSSSSSSSSTSSSISVEQLRSGLIYN